MSAASDPDLAAALAHPHLPPASLERPTDDEHARADADPFQDARHGVARNLAATPALLERLADDPAPSVRLEVARHPRLHRALMQRLCQDPDDEVRATAKRRAQPPSTRPAPL